MILGSEHGLNKCAQWRQFIHCVSFQTGTVTEIREHLYNVLNDRLPLKSAVQCGEGSPPQEDTEPNVNVRQLVEW